VIDKVEKISDDTYSVTGENFTASSRLEINDEMLEDTRPVSNTQFLVKDLDLKDGDKVDIAQQSNSSTKRVLSRSAAIIYQDPNVEDSPVPSTQEPQETPTDTTDN
jgi:hypothetical protein